ncbi:MAG: protein-L-isoaspartate(D-aspartate) O-methyltransferase [Anaerolineae bacterium]|jgi:protein-L-isoaspartate(D-aspartate) O-methyltransferase|nr:protein-L-isoaspartate(D-aspartate) O-methyltransferase [Anaerolineae bacterium]
MENDWQANCQRMVKEQIERRGLTHPALLDALRRVPRHLFVPESSRDYAYSDGPIPIGHGQTISQPYIVALMTSLLDLQGNETVLEVGTGSGYQAAVLSHLAKNVHSVERIPELAEQAARVLGALEIHNVHIHVSDGSIGWQAAAPYEGILVTAAAPHAPQPLLEQLAEGGRLVIPVGARAYQELQVWRRCGKIFEHEPLIGVAFVPLRGAEGWQEDQWE